MTTADHDLLRRYLGGSDEAFAELVRRHLDLVFSAARRQTRSQTLAEEVTQSVFIHLAREAHRISARTPLAAWLHVVTRHTAMDSAKMEARRQSREQIAFEISAMNSTPPDWTRIEPFLDEAVAALAPADRAAVILRFFEGRSLRDVGHGLGTTEEAARKRVSRALEQLRASFLRRGVALSAASLATSLSAQAIQAAPAGLGATVTTVAALCGTALPPPFGAAATTFAMTTIQKALTAAVLTALVGAGLYEGRVIYRQSQQVQVLEKEAAAMEEQKQKVRRERDEALAQANAREAAASSATAAVASANMDSRRVAFRSLTPEEKLRRIRKLFGDRAESWIPELDLLTEAEWLRTLQSVEDLETEEQVRSALAKLRTTAKIKFSSMTVSALRDYRGQYGDAAPGEAAKLADFFKQPISSAILDRYTTDPADFNPLAFRSAIMAEKMKNLADPEYDSLLQVMTMGTELSTGISPARNATDSAYLALKRFQDEGGGPRTAGLPATAAQLAPFLPAPVPIAELEEFVAKLHKNVSQQSRPGSFTVGDAIPGRPAGPAAPATGNK